jgi:hypothetical protein
LYELVFHCSDGQNKPEHKQVYRTVPEMMMDQNSKIKWKRGENYEKEY